MVKKNTTRNMMAEKHKEVAGTHPPPSPKDTFDTNIC